MFDFECDHCGETVSAAPDQMGEFLTCPWCNIPTQVPGSDAPRVPKLAQVPTARQSLTRIEGHLGSLAFWIPLYIIVTLLIGIIFALLSVLYAVKELT